jgi:hypothetical protein
MPVTLKVRLLFGLLTLGFLSCAHQPSASTAKPAPQEAMFDCLAEVVDVKHEVWEVRLTSHFYPATVWQGVLKISLRFLSPLAHAGEIRSLGVYEEREIVVGGRILAAGDTIRFTASDGVLRRSIVPEVFSNLRGVARIENGANKAPEPTTFAVTSRAIVRSAEVKQQNPNSDAARPAPAKVVAHL